MLCKELPEGADEDVRDAFEVRRAALGDIGVVVHAFQCVKERIVRGHSLPSTVLELGQVSVHHL